MQNIVQLFCLETQKSNMHSLAIQEHFNQYAEIWIVTDNPVLHLNYTVIIQSYLQT